MGDAADTDNAARVERGGWPGERLKWWVEKCALPLALVAGPAIFQYMAGQQAAEKHAQEKAQAKIETAAAQKREQTELKFQLYTSLISKREEADSAVRLGLFDKLIGAYWEPKTKDLNKKLVQLEMLSLNFHDAMNLNPLFWELQRSIEQSPRGQRRDELQEHLDRVANGVKERQVALLEVGAARASRDVDLRLVDDGSDTQTYTAPARVEFPAPRFDETGKPGRQQCQFSLQVRKKDALRRRVFVSLESQACEHKPVDFWVDMFDFPLATFSRISPFERVAVVLDGYSAKYQMAQLTVLYFPSTRSATKDKPYIEDLVNRLRTSEESAAAASAAASAASGASAAAR